MKNIFTRFWSFIKRHKTWSAIILIIILIVLYFIFGHKNTVTTPFVLAEKGNIKEVVSVTGNVKPLSDVSLAFERGGRVASINVAVGDKVYVGETLASISNGDLVANLDQANANLKKALAQYQDVKTGTRAEEITLQETQVAKATQDLAQAKISLISAVKDSSTQADDALRNKIYSLFIDPSKYRAKLSFTTDTFLQGDIEKGKDTLSDNLDSWYQSLAKLNSDSDLEVYYNTAKTNLVSVKNLLDECADAVNRLSPSSSFIPQNQIDVWKSNISMARTSINSAIDGLTASYDAYKSLVSALKISQDQLVIKQAGSSAGEISSAEASNEAAQAGVASAEAELAKSMIKSPIDGVITNIVPKLGEIVPANQNVISVISYGDYEVEAFVPEADISKVKIGNLASTTLDAYGSGVNFETAVIKIDPAATVIDSVPTYKVTLKFTNQDERVKSGMTANIDILTAELKKKQIVIEKKDGEV